MLITQCFTNNMIYFMVNIEESRERYPVLVELYFRRNLQSQWSIIFCGFTLTSFNLFSVMVQQTLSFILTVLSITYMIHQVNNS